ncbi:hypothetical protein COJ96_11075 [Bacillus sp. AFS073361]|nr:hypothetical protein COJ96_11075 [Bacillus sp. AFS073361]
MIKPVQLIEQHLKNDSGKRNMETVVSNPIVLCILLKTRRKDCVHALVIKKSYFRQILEKI